MPYVDNETRSHFHEVFNWSSEVSTPGELNFLFTGLLNQYIQNKSLSYQTINDILGALEGAKLEFYRRIAVPYETTKITENGDVY